MKRLFGLLAIVALSLAAKPAVAHHALQAEFDTAKRGEFTGTLTKFAMINPHVRWFFDVKKADGTVEKWEITGAGPQALRSNGMTVLDLTVTHTNTYNPYVIMPIPANVRGGAAGAQSN